MDTKQTCPCGATGVTAKQPGPRGKALKGGASKRYADCCGRYIDLGEPAPTAEALMRSRYTAYALGRGDYLLATWHHGTRPASLELAQLAEDPRRIWLGLEVRRHEQLEPDHAVVEFVARYKIEGRAHRLHETSRFLRKAGRWFYVDGDIA
ncbi:SEC-C motif-containing protein [Nitrosospira sp. Nl5]|uniref:YchJ family protein n=1 Tax=Nitrosospira sp. Nl5 TaxID=200120 RepID=UPI00088EAD7A|nr:YchJ family metal-binding protein [Nitrosospira sp. Nl5]SCY31944.1 SEC-C motif-containing protein [Nitrosospira sp. Nl5]